MAVVKTHLELDPKEVNEQLAQFMAGPDPLIARTESTVGLISPFDAWLLLRGELRNDDLESFRGVATLVLGELDPAAQLMPDERILAPVRGQVAGSARRG